MRRSSAILAPAASLTGHIVGFTTSHTIELEGIAYSAATKLTYTASTHVLKVSDGANSVSLIFDGRYSKANFTLADDGEGHAVIAYAAPAPRAQRFEHVDAAVFGEDAASVGHHHPAAPAADILLVG